MALTLYSLTFYYFCEPYIKGIEKKLRAMLLRKVLFINETYPIRIMVNEEPQIVIHRRNNHAVFQVLGQHSLINHVAM